jgi:hypothetical protein
MNNEKIMIIVSINYEGKQDYPGHMVHHIKHSMAPHFVNGSGNPDIQKFTFD